MEKVIKKLLYRPFLLPTYGKKGFNSESKRSSATEAVTKFRGKENRKHKRRSGGNKNHLLWKI